MRAFPVLVVLFFAVAPVQAGAEGLNFHVGLQTVSFISDLGENYEIPTGPGPVLTVGIPSVLGIPFDLSIGVRSTKEDNTGEEVEYRWLELGPRFFLGKGGARVRAELFGGGGIYGLEIGDLEFDRGAGLYAGFGVEDFVSEKVSGRFQIKGVYWTSDTRNTNASSLNFSLMYGYHF